jgi:methionine-R-sulfoxide reductase
MKTTFLSICLTAMTICTFTSCAQTTPTADTKKTTDSATTAAPQTAGLIVFDTAWTTKIIKTQAEWRAQLTPEQFHITQEQGTERPFSCALNKEHRKGIFYCVCCQNPLFQSDAKFDSGTGWPSYNKTVSSKSVKITRDFSHGMVREAVSCQRCNAHLGHVFNDGPPPTGLRYCTDGTALIFQEKIILK